VSSSRAPAAPTVVGVVSDTHGQLRPQLLAALAAWRPRPALILHAGDVGAPAVLDALAALAPVRAVRGNVDGPPLASRLPATDVVELAGGTIYLIHDLARLDLDPRAANCASSVLASRTPLRPNFRAVVHGHSHRPACFERDGVLYFNPGSAGPSRFELPVSFGRLVLGADGEVRGELLELEV
jgi:putative phosphoesterase